MSAGLGTVPAGADLSRHRPGQPGLRLALRRRPARAGRRSGDALVASGRSAPGRIRSGGDRAARSRWPATLASGGLEGRTRRGFEGPVGAASPAASPTSEGMRCDRAADRDRPADRRTATIAAADRHRRSRLRRQPHLRQHPDRRLRPLDRRGADDPRATSGSRSLRRCRDSRSGPRARSTRRRSNRSGRGWR